MKEKREDKMKNKDERKIMMNKIRKVKKKNVF